MYKKFSINTIETTGLNYKEIEFCRVALEFKGQKIGLSDKRYFLPQQYSQFPWLEFDPEKVKVFCQSCKMIDNLDKLPFSKNREPAFSKTGFCNWTKATMTFK